jgi:hypothetical protein
MSTKKSFHNRVRGWFPQEQKINNIVIAHDADTQNPHATDLHKYGKEISPTQNLNLLLVIALWAVSLLTSFGNLPRLNFAGLVAGGLAIGLILGVTPVSHRTKKANSDWLFKRKNLGNIGCNFVYCRPSISVRKYGG